LCVGIKTVSEAGDVTFAPTCKTRVDIIFSLAAAATSGLGQVFSLLNAGQIRFVVAEYIKRYCDKPDNYETCAKYADALRDLVITVTIDCGTTVATGGDARADGKTGAVDETNSGGSTDASPGTGSNGLRLFEGEDVRAATGCKVRVLVSVANDATTTTTTNTGTSGGFRLFANDATAAAVVNSAVTTDSEAAAEGLAATATYSSTSTNAATLNGPNAAMAAIVAAAFAALL
jgi:hypothetical protein